MTYNNNNTNKATKTEKKDPDVEDWDEEIEQNIVYQETMATCAERHQFQDSPVIDDFQNTVNRYPPAVQAFSATAHYDSFVYKKCQKLKAHAPVSRPSYDLLIVDGQFDDM